MKDLLNPVNILKYFRTGRRFYTNSFYATARACDDSQKTREPNRTSIINALIAFLNRPITYLEIGVRNPGDNFDHIVADQKYSVDPGVEFEANPVDFKLTSDAFFEKLGKGDVLSKEIKFDVIFIDGLHLAEQVDRDIRNALDYIKDDGFVVLHDCNPPTEWHARDTYGYYLSPARGSWNGTTWKAFQKWRFDPAVNSCCIDTDYGVGIISKTQHIGKSIAPVNPFFEYAEMAESRKEALNLITFDELMLGLK